MYPIYQCVYVEVYRISVTETLFLYLCIAGCGVWASCEFSSENAAL